MFKLDKIQEHYKCDSKILTEVGMFSKHPMSRGRINANTIKIHASYQKVKFLTRLTFTDQTMKQVTKNLEDQNQ